MLSYLRRFASTHPAVCGAGIAQLIDTQQTLEGKRESVRTLRGYSSYMDKPNPNGYLTLQTHIFAPISFSFERNLFIVNLKSA